MEIQIEKIIFDAVISIGTNCNVGSALSKTGFRSFSGPFDWNVASIDGIFKCMSMDFSDFLNKDNLQPVPGEPRHFRDIKYNIHFIHDVSNNYIDELEAIREKYLRRIANFRKALANGSCFIRLLTYQGEMDWIAANYTAFIDSFKKHNSSNEVIFLIPPHVNVPGNLALHFYRYNEAGATGTRRERMRDFFSCIEGNKLVEYLTEHYDSAKIAANIVFDKKYEADRANRVDSLISDIDGADFTALKFDYPVIIYGAAEVGKYLYDKIGGSVNVIGFLDKYSVEGAYKDKKIFHFNDYRYEPGSRLIITPMQLLDAITKDLVGICHVPQESIVSLHDFCMGSDR